MAGGGLNLFGSESSSIVNETSIANSYNTSQTFETNLDRVGNIVIGGSGEASNSLLGSGTQDLVKFIPLILAAIVLLAVLFKGK